MKNSTDTVADKLEKLKIALHSASSFLLEGYNLNPGAAALRRNKLLGTETKSSSKDLVTFFDQKVEAYLLDVFKKTFPEDEVIGEETVAKKKLKAHNFLKQYENADGIWIFDPIDGTTNYSKAYPFFCVTAAFIRYSKKLKRWEPLIGALLNPLTQEIYSAAQGCGAWLNRRRMRVTETKNPLESLWITGFASEKSTEGQRPFDIFTNITKKTLGVRRDGSAALDLAYVAAGRVEGFWEWGLAPWDIASGALFVSEAGGKVTDLSGAPIDIQKGEIIAANSALHKWLLSSIKETNNESARY